MPPERRSIPMPTPKGKTTPFWSRQRVIVTGGAGFLGSHVVDNLRTRGCSSIIVPRSKETDLRVGSQIDRLLKEGQPTMIIHLAANCGGIGKNQDHPGQLFYDNAMMGIQLMEKARHIDNLKFVQVGTVCSYPKTPVPFRIPFREEELWSGYPEETNAPYGLAKKMLLVQAQAYRLEYGFNAIYLMPANLYGPRDNFDLHNSHVIPAMIRKFLDAKDHRQSSVTLWGSGSPTRDFFYVEDAAEGIVLAAEKYNDAEPVNLGTGEEMKVKTLAKIIAGLVGFTGPIVWDRHKPDGQPRRAISAERAAQAFGFQARTPLKEGLKKTIEWYLAAQK